MTLSNEPQVINLDAISEINSLQQSQHVTLHWIPSQCGIPGNEITNSFIETDGNLNQLPSGLQWNQNYHPQQHKIERRYISAN
jgi:hypothetical protein